MGLLSLDDFFARAWDELRDGGSRLLGRRARGGMHRKGNYGKELLN